MIISNALRCPLCNNIFVNNGDSLICNNKHTYDIAHSGYINLLPVNTKNSKNPGDSKAMVVARKNFLTMDYYLPIISQINAFIETTMAPNVKTSVLDAGCGEGYYLTKIKNYFNNRINCLGVDISRAAIQAAAKRSTEICWCVASVYNLPIANHSQDIIINIFSPYNFKEFLRVAKKHAVIILVIPNDAHLIEIRDIVYKTKQNYTSDKRLSCKLQEHPGVQEISTQQVTYNFNLVDQYAIKNLFAMTPFYWRSNQTVHQILANKESMSITVDVKLVFLQVI